MVRDQKRREEGRRRLPDEFEQKRQHGRERDLPPGEQFHYRFEREPITHRLLGTCRLGRADFPAEENEHRQRGHGAECDRRSPTEPLADGGRRDRREQSCQRCPGVVQADRGADVVQFASQQCRRDAVVQSRDATQNEREDEEDRHRRREREQGARDRRQSDRDENDEPLTVSVGQHAARELCESVRHPETRQGESEESGRRVERLDDLGDDRADHQPSDHRREERQRAENDERRSIVPDSVHSVR